MSMSLQRAEVGRLEVRMRAWIPIRRRSYLATDVVERVDAAVIDLSALPGALLATVAIPPTMANYGTRERTVRHAAYLCQAIRFG